jgi:hypothetical protein
MRIRIPRALRQGFDYLDSRIEPVRDQLEKPIGLTIRSYKVQRWDVAVGILCLLSGVGWAWWIGNWTVGFGEGMLMSVLGYMISWIRW